MKKTLSLFFLSVLTACTSDINTLPNTIVSKELKLSPAQYFVNQLETVGFFKYAEPQHREMLKASYLSDYNTVGFSGEEFDEDTSQSLDYRYHFLDGENLFEREGFTDKLSELKPTFDKMGFKLTINEDIEEWDEDNQWSNHYITINDTKHTVFRHFKGFGWGESAKKFAEILNAEFAKQNIEERIYLINGGHNGIMLILTPEQYQIFYKLYSDPYQKPLEVNEWAKVMEVG